MNGLSNGKGKWMGIDYGSVRIGVAVSDPLGMIARGLETIRWNGKDMDWALNRIAELVSEQQIAGLVIGVPRRTDGKIGESETKARHFAELLKEKTGIDPVLKDERYTTVIAARVMRETGRKSKQRNKIIDQIAAEIILQEHLESLR